MGKSKWLHPDGQVTGQILAVQIEYGKSFFQEKNRLGYIYRGDEKHFNYLGGNWKITVPFENNLAESKAQLEALLTATQGPSERP